MRKYSIAAGRGLSLNQGWQIQSIWSVHVIVAASVNIISARRGKGFKTKIINIMPCFCSKTTFQSHLSRKLERNIAPFT
jgi:hypothetical protein